MKSNQATWSIQINALQKYAEAPADGAWVLVGKDSLVLAHMAIKLSLGKEHAVF